MGFCFLINENISLKAVHEVVTEGMNLQPHDYSWINEIVSMDVQVPAVHKALVWLHLSRHILWL